MVSDKFRTTSSVTYAPDGAELWVGLRGDTIDGSAGPEDIIVLDSATLEQRSAFEVGDIGMRGITQLARLPGLDQLLIVHCCDWSGTDEIPAAPTFRALHDPADGSELWRVDGLDVMAAFLLRLR